MKCECGTELTMPEKEAERLNLERIASVRRFGDTGKTIVTCKSCHHKYQWTTTGKLIELTARSTSSKLSI